ncbi:MAG: hypothetical protein ACOCXJ_02330 [Planctomycetota bacterium]
MSTATDAHLERLRQAMQQPHLGLYITGPGRLEVLEEALPERCFDGQHVITRSLGNLRCTSDSKAIKQFTGHTRVPDAGTPVALGHECIQQVVAAPPESGLQPGDLVLITPGHASFPIDIERFEPDPAGTLPSLGYTYRQAGGLRQFSALPLLAMELVRSQGFGELYNRIPSHPSATLASLAHAEAFACCYGSNQPLYTLDGQGRFVMGIPPGARLALLGGTARMGLINLTIIAGLPEQQRPRSVVLTGSRAKLDELQGCAVFERLREQGVDLRLIDRRAPDIIDALTAPGRPDIIWTNYDAQEVYDQASAIIAPGGNINNYAGARDPEIGFTMRIAAAPDHPDAASAARAWLQAMHHGVGAIEYERRFGLRPGGLCTFAGFATDDPRLPAFLQALPTGQRVAGIPAPLQPQHPDLQFESPDQPADDVFIAGSGETAAAIYAERELQLARGAAVAFVDGNCTIRIRSRNAHYQSVHQICGPNVPWYMTNTSIPTADDMAVQGRDPLDFDWLIKAIAGLRHAPALYADVEGRQPFGSFFMFTELPELPYVTISAAAFEEALADQEAGPVRSALEAGLAVLRRDGDRYSRALEEALYAGYGEPYPLTIAE